MSKGLGKAAVGGLIVLWMANTASPGTAEKVVQSGTETVNPIVDGVAGTANEHVIPAAGDTLTAAKDGLAQTNLLGPSTPPAWAEPEPSGQ
jgi:hypothetical protein